MKDNILGKKFGHWTILEVLKGGKVKCQCDCENHTVKVLDKYSVTHGKSTSCGCANKAKALTPGTQFGFWTVVQDVDKDYAICRCICGKEKQVQKGHLKNGSSTSCGCMKGVRTNLEGQTINYYTVVKELGGGKVLAQCVCGTVKELNKNQLITGRVKSCGCMSRKLKSESLINDMTGQTINSWTILKELGGGKVLAKCSCGEVRELLKGSILNGASKSCGHDTNKKNDLTNQTIWNWTVLKEMGHGNVLCRCKCGTERVIQKATLLSGTSKSCGCDQYKNFRETCLKKYGEVTANKIGNPREQWQIDAVQSKEALIDCINKRFIKKPTIYELTNLLGINEASIGRVLKNIDAYDVVDFRPSRSHKEAELSNWIAENCNVAVINNTRKILSGKEIDIYIPSKKVGIEFNGSYWHSYPIKPKTYHQDKTIECLRAGIRLIHIFEYEWDNPETQSKIKEYLKDILCDKQVVYARNTEVKEITLQQSMDFQAKYHLQGSIQSKINIGIFNNGELLGVLALSTPRFYNNIYDYEILRMCYKSGITVVGGAEKMFKYFIDKYSPSSVFTYADISKFTGNIYLRMGFKLSSKNQITVPNYVWVSLDGENVVPRYKTTKQKLLDAGFGDYGSTEDEIMENLGYLKIYDCGSLRLEYFKDVQR